ncbi:hypothetical protein B0H67DRAFT_585197 [Lasiosphaeris hirsuta]|uniref:YMC020W-like alpha/beta hydrolase domain-containing protein n=1 Tax=Lasiosphaeris hirsuta TaxID=260670 RepID=A0AA40DPL8_9PEZI|nr:hypothetical protein B0H67DRAFT_585197 [Lasiosphaeris hirsuta]
MGPRKRAKPNPVEASASLATAMPSQQTSSTSQSLSQPSQPSQSSSHSSKSRSTTATPTPSHTTPQLSQLSITPNGTEGSSATPTKSTKQVRETRSWYGSWPRKSSASTQVARETILGGTVKSRTTADFSRFSTKKDADGMSLDEPLASAPTLPEIEECGEIPGAGAAGLGAVETTKPPQQLAGNAVKPQKVDGKKTDESQEQITGPVVDAPIVPQAAVEPVANPPATSGWLGWFGRPTQAATDVTEIKPDEQPKADEMASNDVKPLGPLNTEAAKPVHQEQPVVEQPEPPSEPAVQQGRPATASGGYWFGLWYTSSAATPAPAPDAQVDAVPVTAAPDEPVQPVKEPEDIVMQDAPPVEAAPAPPPKAGSTWAFWSRDTGSASETKSIQQAEEGQLAVIGDSSESHPKRANSFEVRDTPVKEPSLKSAKSSKKDDQSKPVATPSKEILSKKNKRTRPLSMTADELTPSRPGTPVPDTSSKAEPAAKAGASKAPTPPKALTTNVLLPSFGNTYRLKENPSIMRQIAQLLLRTQQPPAKHVHLSKDQPKIKKAIAIGVHGLFPASYLRPMIGQPTGTSIKFANHCVSAIRRWADAHGSEDCEIEKVALEGEGKIGDRVENLWKLLLNWIDHIRSADLILLGCHSQGVPVTIMLLAKLYELGVITTAKVGVCAMAGVSLGPFPDYKSSMGILMGTAAELWEFADPQSEVSKRLEASIKVVLGYGARITFIGSMDDQLVPLESAIYAPVHHPYIYRAVFIDGRIHAPDFIAHLVGFALRLRNLGVTDHGLIRELSTPLAGSLYSGEGHSRLYDDDQVYDLAVTHALETTSIGDVPCEVHQRQGGAGSPNNPYHLPWIMRGLLEEDFVRTELNSETAELLRQFDDWKPTTKALKDVKYRLESVRSKL